MERYKSLKLAALSPNQCPPWRPALANVDREIKTLRFPLIFFNALIKNHKYTKMYLARVEETLLSLNEPKSLSGSHFLRKNFKLYNRSRLLLVCGTNSEKKKRKVAAQKPGRAKKISVYYCWPTYLSLGQKCSYVQCWLLFESADELSVKRMLTTIHVKAVVHYFSEVSCKAPRVLSWLFASEFHRDYPRP